MKKSIFNASLVAILVIGGIVASFLYQSMTKRPSYSEIQAKTGNITEELNFTGSVKPQDNADLGFEEGGKITKLTHQVGDFVPAGTVLALANASDLQAQYQQAQDLAQMAQANLDQYQALVDKAKEQLDSLKHNHAISEDKDAQKAQIDASEAQVEAQKQSVAAALANVESAKAQLDKKIIMAPFAGIISKQDVKAGEVAQSNVPIISLISRDAFKVEAYVSEIDVKKIQAGDSARITVDDNPGQVYAAKIAAIDPAESMINNVSSYKITLAFADPATGLRSGVGANVSLEAQSKQDVLLVPQDAVFEQGGKKFVYANVDGLRAQKEVQTGIYGSDNMVEIVSGLKAGDTIFELSK